MNKRILLIDSITAYPIIYSVLTREGYRVEDVDDHESGLQRLKRRNYDVIIVRDNPGAESWQLCEKIRAITISPLIVINSNATTEACARAIDAGADFFMRKPFGTFELLARIQCLLQRAAFYHPLPVGLYLH